MLFEVFKSTGTDELGYDDIVMMLQVVAMSLHRLWFATEWDQSKWSHLTEALSDGAYAKVSGYQEECTLTSAAMAICVRSRRIMLFVLYVTPSSCSWRRS
jgi:hypothetical protein